jgi:hypothetical protein
MYFSSSNACKVLLRLLTDEQKKELNKQLIDELETG